VVRNGRVDRKIRVNRPDQKGAEQIFKLYLKKVPLESDLTVDDAAVQTAALMYDPKYKYYQLFDSKNRKVDFTLASLANGAMIAGAVDQAVSKAMLRDIDNGGKVKGITMTDLSDAVNTIFEENKHMNHQLELEEFMDANKLSIEQVVRMDAA